MTIETLLHWIKERESIRRKKEAGEPRPWTTDTILDTYRFCNVRRMDDRVSRWLTDNWYRPFAGHPNLWFACAVARQINWPDTLAELTSVVFDDQVSGGAIYEVLADRTQRKEKVYTGAYVLSGTLGGTKIEQTALKILGPLLRDPPPLRPTSLQETHRGFLERPGFASFMAGQVVADMHSAGVLDPADALTWAPIGPGSTRGLNRLADKRVESRWPWAGRVENPIERMREVAAIVKAELPEIWEDRGLVLMDIQNCLCEYDKYMRTLNGEGRPRSMYR